MSAPKPPERQKTPLDLMFQSFDEVMPHDHTLVTIEDARAELAALREVTEAARNLKSRKAAYLECDGDQIFTKFKELANSEDEINKALAKLDAITGGKL